MTLQLPLYDALAALVASEGAPKVGETENLKKLCLKINDLPDKHLEIIYVLILHHYYQNMEKDKLKLPPYEGKIADNLTKRGIMYNISLLPELLQKIIREYIHQINT